MYVQYVCAVYKGFFVSIQVSKCMYICLIFFQALIRVTAASNETIQDGYLYYYACLKMAEFKMLAAACNEELHELGRHPSSPIITT